MSYELNFVMQPPVKRQKVIDHFVARRNYKVDGDDVAYQNLDTDVGFQMRLRCAKTLLLRPTVTGMDFEMNYGRPSFFGLEAENEVAAFVTAFNPRINDPQMHGMGEGPYSRQGFLDGWNFGNVFAVSKWIQDARKKKFLTLPSATLLHAWNWNYKLSERRDFYDRSAFVPYIWFYFIGDELRTAALWPEGDPVILPRVDLVSVGWFVDGEKHFGLAPWAEAEDIARSAGFDASTDPIDIRFLIRPPAIAQWVATMPAVARIIYVEPYLVVDEELVAAARAGLEAQEVGASPV